MTGSIPPSGPLSYEGQVSVPYIVKTFDPLPANNKFPLPTVWVNSEEKKAFISVSKDFGTTEWVSIGGIPGQAETLTGNDSVVVAPTDGNINVEGSVLYDVLGDSASSTLTITPRSNAYPTTPYVVGPVGKAGYQTIQSALDAANAAGGGMVWVQPGTYTENLTFYSGIQLSTPSEQTVTIIGTHTPPDAGTLNLDRMTLQSATNIFSSASAGTCSIIMEDCSVAVTNGYTFNLPNWTGSIACFNIGPFGTNDGFLNNTGGASFFCYAAGFGNGTANPMIISGVTAFDGANVFCPINFVTGASFEIDSSTLNGTVTFSNNSTGAISNSRIDTGASPAAVMSSTAEVKISNSIIGSSNNPAIDGAGAGTLTLGSITFTDNAIISGTVNSTGASGFLPGQFGTSGQVLTSNGPGVVPSFQTNAASDLHVAKFIVSAGGSASGANYTTIASAIAAASSGDTIYLSDGTYTEDLTLKDGVNLASLSGFSSFSSNQQGNVTIIGKMIDGGGSIRSNITGINFQTNGDYVASLTGASTVNFFACFFNGLNNTIFNSTNASARLNVDTCDADLKTTGIAFYSISNGTIFFNACNLANSGSSTTPSSASAGVAYFTYCQTNAAIESTGTAGTTALYSEFFTGLLNITAVTFNGTAANSTAMGHCYITSGTASAVSIGAGVTCDLYECTIASTNTNAIAGAGAVNYTGISFFPGFSSKISTTTQTGGLLKGGVTQAPSAGFIGEHVRNYVTGVSMVTSITKTVSSISLTAGVWDVSFINTFNFSTSAGTYAITSLSATDNVLGSGNGDVINYMQFATNIFGLITGVVPAYRLTLTSTTTYYGTAQVVFSGGTCTCSGRLSATRVG